MYIIQRGEKNRVLKVPLGGEKGNRTKESPHTNNKGQGAGQPKSPLLGQREKQLYDS